MFAITLLGCIISWCKGQGYNLSCSQRYTVPMKLHKIISRLSFGEQKGAGFVCPLVLISYSSKFHPAWHEDLTISECACVDTKQVLTVMPKDILEQEVCDTEAQCGVPGGDWGSRSQSCRAIYCGHICNKR